MVSHVTVSGTHGGGDGGGKGDGGNVGGVGGGSREHGAHAPQSAKAHFACQSSECPSHHQAHTGGGAGGEGSEGGGGAGGGGAGGGEGGGGEGDAGGDDGGWQPPQTAYGPLVESPIPSNGGLGSSVYQTERYLLELCT